MYRNDQTERARLRKLWIVEQDRPCAECGGRDHREIAHKTTEANSRVLCYQCHRNEHPFSKFVVGDKVRLTDRIPDDLDFTSYERSRPRTIISIRYDADRQCNYYRLGSNARGKMLDGQPQDGYDFDFRSYHLEHYIPRTYHFKRAYRMKPTDSRLTPSTSAAVATGKGISVYSQQVSRRK